MSFVRFRFCNESTHSGANVWHNGPVSWVSRIFLGKLHQLCVDASGVHLFELDTPWESTFNVSAMESAFSGKISQWRLDILGNKCLDPKHDVHVHGCSFKMYVKWVLSFNPKAEVFVCCKQFSCWFPLKNEVAIIVVHSTSACARSSTRGL